jgi:hypothetical protein
MPAARGSSTSTSSSSSTGGRFTKRSEMWLWDYPVYVQFMYCDLFPDKFPYDFFRKIVVCFKKSSVSVQLNLFLHYYFFSFFRWGQFKNLCFGRFYSVGNLFFFHCYKSSESFDDAPYLCPDRIDGFSFSTEKVRHDLTKIVRSVPVYDTGTTK